MTPRPLSTDVDLLSLLGPGGFFFERGGDGVVANGVAARVDVDPGPGLAERASEAAALLLREHGDDAIVVGAIPFDERSDSTLLFVPQSAVIRHGTQVRELGEPSVIPDRNSTSGAVAGGAMFDPPRDEYVAAVRKARDMIHAGELEKVVLARSVVLRTQIEPHAVLRRLREADPGAYAFCVDGMVGATPELLLAKHGREVRSQPLAGSARRRRVPAEDAAAANALMASAKDRAEHAFVASAVAQTLAPLCERIHVDAQPSLLSTSRVWHLATTVYGTLARNDQNALSLAGSLHPTPAVCGTPRAAAMEAIRDLEHLDRGLYAGLVGWMDARGDGEWAIALRCAHQEGDMLRLFAGAGIVEASDPESELEETDAKLEVLLKALGI